VQRRLLAMQSKASVMLQCAWRSHASRSRARARALAVIHTATQWNRPPPVNTKQRKQVYLTRYKSQPPASLPQPPLRPLPPLMTHAMVLQRTAAAAATAAVCLVSSVRCLRARRLHRVLSSSAAEAARGPVATSIQRVVRGRIGRVRVQLICARALDDVRNILRRCVKALMWQSCI